MDTRLLHRLLDLYHADEDVFSVSPAVARFLDRYALGVPAGRGGRQMRLRPHDKTALAALLKAEEGVEATTTFSADWAGRSRAQSLSLAANEKHTSRVVRHQRIAIKTLPGLPLRLNGKTLTLPEGMSLDVDFETVALGAAHRAVLLVENWEAFDRIHALSFDTGLRPLNPVVLFKGSPVYREDHARAFMARLALPVHAFMDFDPAGLAMAQGLPHLAGLVSPDDATLQTALAACTNTERYLAQLPGALGVLDDEGLHPSLRVAWNLVKSAGVALPQEVFIGG